MSSDQTYQAASATNIPVTSAHVRIFGPDNDGTTKDEADYVFYSNSAQSASSRLESVDISERVQERKDTGTVVLDNTDGALTDAVTSGDRVQLHVNSAFTGARPYDTGTYDTGKYQPSSLVWTGLIRNRTLTRVHANRGVLTLELEDFVFSVLSMRIIDDAFEQRPIAGSEDAILNTILRAKASEVSTEDLPTISTVTDEFLNGRNLLDAVVGLARKANCLMSSAGRRLRFEPIDEKTPIVTLTADDLTAYEVRETDDHLFNQLRVDGANGYAEDPKVRQTDAANTATVTSGSRETTQIAARKDEIDRIEIWTRADRSEDADGLVVRLQADDGGAPVDIDDKDSDLASKQLSSEFLSADDWTTFILPKHSLDNTDPWLIIESEGETGQDIGVSTGGVPAYRTYYPFPVSVQRQRAASQSNYRLRERRKKDDGLGTFPAARDLADAQLDHADEPRRELSFAPASQTALTLDAAQSVETDLPLVGATGTYIITEKNFELTDGRISMNYVAQEADTL